MTRFPCCLEGVEARIMLLEEARSGRRWRIQKRIRAGGVGHAHEDLLDTAEIERGLFTIDTEEIQLFAHDIDNVWDGYRRRLTLCMCVESCQAHTRDSSGDRCHGREEFVIADAVFRIDQRSMEDVFQASFDFLVLI
jgi:hypothetical protein